MSTSTKGTRKRQRSATVAVELYERAFIEGGIEPPKRWSRLPSPAPTTANAVPRA